MLPNEGGQKHVVRDTKGQYGSREDDCYRAEKESCVNQDREVLEARDKCRLEQDRKCDKPSQKMILIVTYLSTQV